MIYEGEFRPNFMNYTGAAEYTKAGLSELGWVIFQALWQSVVFCVVFSLNFIPTRLLILAWVFLLASGAAYSVQLLPFALNFWAAVTCAVILHLAWRRYFPKRAPRIHPPLPERSPFSTNPVTE